MHFLYIAKCLENEGWKQTFWSFDGGQRWGNIQGDFKSLY